jgi:hypothetical protein
VGDLGSRQARKQIFQVINRVDAMPPATAQQGVDHRAAFTSFGVPNKQKFFLLWKAFHNTNYDNLLIMQS